MGKNFVNCPFVALRKMAHFAPWGQFFYFSFLNYGRFYRKPGRHTKKSSPTSVCQRAGWISLYQMIWFRSLFYCIGDTCVTANRWIRQNGISRYGKPRCCLGSHHMWSWAESPITLKRSRLEAKGSVGEWAAEWHIWLSAHGSHHQPWAHNLRRYWAKPPNHRPRWETATTYHLHLIHWALLPPQYGWILSFFSILLKRLCAQSQKVSPNSSFLVSCPTRVEALPNLWLQSIFSGNGWREHVLESTSSQLTSAWSNDSF